MQEVFLASNNPGKQKEFLELLTAFNIKVKFPQDLPFYQEPEETANTFVENALIKARHGAKVSGMPCLSDDSGLCVPALNGEPGVYSARYAGGKDNQANNHKLIEEISKIPEGQRQAYYCCVLVWIAYEHDPMPLIFQGLWHGEIITEARGKGGFGYDPLFYIPELQKTAAEVDAATKHCLSHRGQALQQLLEFFNEKR